MAVPSGRRAQPLYPRPPYWYFQQFTPKQKAGYSIFIYHVTPEEANGVHARLGLPWVADTEGRP